MYRLLNKFKINAAIVCALALLTLFMQSLHPLLAMPAAQQTPNKQPIQPQAGPDQDGDWVSDVDEKRFGSDATLVDTDGDDMSDFEEIFILLTDPSEADIDSDGDGFFDQVEEQLFKTDPNQADNDQDGDLIPDTTERTLGSDPNKADSDQDLLSDFVELFLLKSQPNKADPDKDSNGYPDVLQAWLPQQLQKTSCRANVTLTVDSLTVVDPEEADSKTNMSGGDETTVIYGIQVSPPNQPVVFLKNGIFDGDIWNGDAYEGDVFTNFRTLGPLQAECGQIITVVLTAVESDGFMGETQMGQFQVDTPLEFKRLPVSWDYALQQEHVFEGRGVDGSYEYVMVYTLKVALGGTQLQGLPQLNEEQLSLVNNSDALFTCTADNLAGSSLVPVTSRQQSEEQTVKAQNQQFLFEDQFDDNKGRWTISSYQGTEISDGSLGFDSRRLPAGIRYFWYPESVNHHTTLRSATQGDFTLEIEFSDFKTAPNPDNFIVILMVRNLDSGALTNVFEIGNGNQWIFLDFVDDDEKSESGDLPAAINLLDGEQHSMRWKVANHDGHAIHTLIVDNIEVTSLERDTELHGSPLFGFGHDKPKEEDRTASVRVDRFAVTATGTNLEPGTGMGPFTEQLAIENGRLTMQHPADWYVTAPADPTSQSSNGAVNNVAMFNSPSGFIGASNEMALTIYEPVYVMETAGIIDATKVEVEDLLYPFVKAELKELARSDRPKLSVFEKITVCGKPLLRTTVEVATGTITWVASRNSDQTVSITKIQLPKAQLEELMPTPLGMISTLDYIAPPHTVRELDGPGIAAKEFMMAMTQGNLDDAINMICTPERLFFSMADFFLSDIFNTNVIENLALEGYKLDDSYRYYETVWTGKDDEGDESAFVRLSGHIVHIHPDGTEYVVAQSRAPIFGRSTIIRVEKENDVWRVCQGMKFKW